MISATTSFEREMKPVFLSTVTPAKFPTFCRRPVSALKSEDFPLLGFPTRAILIVFFTGNFSINLSLNHYSICFILSQTQHVRSYLHVDRITERRNLINDHRFTRKKSKFH